MPSASTLAIAAAAAVANLVIIGGGAAVLGGSALVASSSSEPARAVTAARSTSSPSSSTYARSADVPCPPGQTAAGVTTDTCAPYADEPESETSSASSAPADEGPARIGRDGFTWDDGVKATVVSAKRYRIGEYAAGGKPGEQGVIVTVVVTNGSDEPLDLDLAQVGASFGDGGDNAESVFDSGKFESGFSGKVAPGRKATGKFGFAVPKGTTSIGVEVAPSFDHDSVLFEGRIS